MQLVCKLMSLDNMPSLLLLLDSGHWFFSVKILLQKIKYNAIINIFLHVFTATMCFFVWIEKKYIYIFSFFLSLPFQFYFLLCSCRQLNNTISSVSSLVQKDSKLLYKLAGRRERKYGDDSGVLLLNERTGSEYMKEQIWQIRKKSMGGRLVRNEME